MAGQTIRCPHCQKKLTVPRAKGKATPPPPPVASAAHEAKAAESFAFVEDDVSTVEKYRRRRKSRLPLVVILFVTASLAVAAVFLAPLLTNRGTPALKPMGDIVVTEGRKAAFRLQLTDPRRWENRVIFELTASPPGASLDRQSGEFAWTPEEKDGPGDFQVTARVSVKGTEQKSSVQTYRIQVLEQNRKPTVEIPSDVTVTDGETLRIVIRATDPDEPRVPLVYTLAKGPAGAEVDAKTGELTWTADAAAAGENVEFAVRVREDSPEGLQAIARFPVTVVARVRPVDRLVATLREQGAKTAIVPGTFVHAFKGTGLTLLIDGRETRVIEYESDDAARRDVVQLVTHRNRFEMPATPESWAGPLRYFHNRDLIVVYAGLDPDFTENLVRWLGEPLESSAKRLPAPAEPAPAEPAPAEPEPAQEPPDRFSTDQTAQLLELYENGQLFRTRQYQALRAIFADRFQREQAEAIEAVINVDDKELSQWLDDHQEIKEEFYRAIDPAVDNVPEVLRLFGKLRREFPDHMVPYANLAIAVAITWDNPNAVNVHAGPMQQGKAIQPQPVCDAMGNFKYYVDAEPAMQGRIRYLPWEFLIHIVNHTTPVEERQWAMQTYLGRRAMFGSCYKDVPYDHGMLDSNNQTGKIHGQPYTLPNLLRLGGVCAHQADFATRVGKCLGVPAAYNSGESRFGEHHAWVMWVELNSVTPQGIGFTLESYGRYRGDHYYVGNLREPQSGKPITDRQLELHLHTIGVSPLAKRQADMVMTAFPFLAEKASMDVVKRFLFLRDTLELCPGNQAAWSALARMSSDPLVRKKHRKDMLAILDQLFVTFARFPDFTWTIFDDLIAFEEAIKQRIGYYERLVTLYELQGRPDLACEARLRLADMLVENAQTNDAIQGLAFSIMKFPEEGRYVPRMLDKLEALSGNDDGARQQLLTFYQTFLPRIPTKRGDRPSPYCIEMYERAIKRFQEAGQSQLVQVLSAQLALIRAGTSGS